MTLSEIRRAKAEAWGRHRGEDVRRLLKLEAARLHKIEADRARRRAKTDG